MKILSGNFNDKMGRKDIFKLTTGNESLHNISNYNGLRVINFALFENLTEKSTCSHITTSINIIGHLQMVKPTITLAYTDRQVKALECN
jgi:hypothetical protein